MPFKKLRKYYKALSVIEDRINRIHGLIGAGAMIERLKKARMNVYQTIQESW